MRDECVPRETSIARSPNAARFCEGWHDSRQPGNLPADMRDRVRKTLEDRLDAPAAITFECAPAMAWGVELRGSGQRIGWTPDAYLDSLEDKLRAALDKAAAQNYPVVV